MAKKVNKEPTSKQLFGKPVEQPTEEKMKKSEPGLFDYVNMLFKNPVEFTSLKPYNKGRNFFMMNRFFSMGFPVQAQMFNHVRINPAEASQYWCDSLSKMYRSTPGWIFSTLKRIKNTKTEKKSEQRVDDETVLAYCKRYDYSKKDIEDAMNFYPTQMRDELIQFENQLNGSTLKK